MNTNKIFWGVFFIVVGTSLLLAQLGVVVIPWYAVWRFWPLILILWGIAVLVGNRPARGIITAAIAVGAGLLLLGLFSFSWLPRLSWNGERTHAETQVFESSIDSAIQRASLRLDAAAGSFKLQESTNKLFHAETESNIGSYSLARTEINGVTELDFRMQGRQRGVHLGHNRNLCEIRLNKSPVWDLSFDVGAAAVDFDLSEFKTSTLRLDGGAASVKLKLGANVEETRASIDVGASSVKIAVPEDAGCEISLDTGLSSKSLHEFNKVGDGKYRTENFGSASKRIYLTIDAGVSSVRVDRY